MTVDHEHTPARRAPRGSSAIVGRIVGGVALLVIAGGSGTFGLVWSCGRPGRTVSPMALCPYDPVSATIMFTIAGLSLGTALWCLSMVRRPGTLRWFALGGLIVAGITAALR